MKYILLFISFILISFNGTAQLDKIKKIVGGIKSGKEILNKLTDRDSTSKLSTRNISSTAKTKQISLTDTGKIIIPPKEFGLLEIHEYAKSGEVLKLKEVIEKGIFVDFPSQRSTSEYSQTKSHLTPLMIAVQHKQIEACKLLILYGADPNLKNADNKSSIDLARESNDTNLLRILVNKEINLYSKDWQSYLKRGQEAYRAGEYVISNAFGWVSLNLLNKQGIASKYTQEVGVIMSLLAESYEKMYILSKAEYFYNQQFNFIEKNNGIGSPEAAKSLVKLADFYINTAQFVRADLLLKILKNWSSENPEKEKMVHAKIMDHIALSLVIRGKEGSANWFIKSLNTKKALVGENHYEYALTMLNIFRHKKANLQEKSFSDKARAGFTGLFTQQIEAQGKMIGDLAFGVDSTRKTDTTQLSTNDKMRKQFQEGLKSDSQIAGKILGDPLYELIVLNGKKEITFTSVLVENIVQQIKLTEGEHTPNYRDALLFLAFAYEKDNKLALKENVQKQISEFDKKVKSINFQRGLAYFPDIELLEYDALIDYSAKNLKSIDYLFKQKNVIEKIFGKVHLAYINVLAGISGAYSHNKMPLVSTFYQEQKDMLTTYLETHYSDPVISQNIYNLLMSDFETHRNQLKNYMLYWSKKNDIAVNELYNLILNDKQKLLLKYKKFKQTNFIAAKQVTSQMNEELIEISKKTGIPMDFINTYGMSQEQHSQLINNTKNIARNIAFLGKKVLSSDIPSTFENGEEIDPESKKNSWKQVQSKLTKGQLVIEYFYIDKSKTNPDSNGIDYYALVLKSDTSKITLKYLFNQNDLIPQLSHQNNKNLINSVYRGVEVEGNNQKSLIISGKLYELCWKPIFGFLQPSDTVIYYSPAGLLHNVSFVAITTPQGKLLSELYKLNYVSSSAKLLEPISALKISKQTSIALFGNPYTTGNDLPKALDEVNKIKTLFTSKTQNINLYVGKDATESNFKKIGNKTSSPTIIHIATHGKYNVDSIQSKNINALIRSYLLMANGSTNQLLNLEIDDDGVLTALEVSTLDFSKTNLVVLSACESGLGGNGGDEGVIGLQRSFQMAGAEYIISSLWPVPDEKTAELMDYFYTALNNGQSIPKAFEIAQRKMIQNKYEIADWAAFVLMQ